MSRVSSAPSLMTKDAYNSLFFNAATMREEKKPKQRRACCTCNGVNFTGEKFREFSNTTTVHGFSHFVAATHVVEKIVYGVAIVASISLTITCLYQVIQRYIDAPNTISMEYLEAGQEGLEMPNITFCVPFRMMRNRLESNYKFPNNSKYLLQYLNLPFRLQEFPSAPKNFLSRISQSENDCGKNELACHERALSIAEDEFQQFKKAQTKPFDIAEFFTEIAPNCSDVFVYCKPTQTSEFSYCCDVGQIIKFIGGTGTCFRFDVSAVTKNQTTPGPRGGLSTIIQLPATEQLMPVIANSIFENGIRVYLSAMDAMLEREPILVAYDSKNLVSLRLTKQKRLSGCKKHAEVKTDDYRYNYTQERCILECLWSTFQNHCNCIEVITANAYIPSLKKYQACDPLKYLNCLDKVGGTENVLTRCRSMCPVPCETRIFTSSVANVPTVIPFLETNLRKYLADNASIWLDVYYSTLMYTEIEEHRSAHIFSIISDIGGQLGLWLGASFISLLHIILCLVNKIIGTRPAMETEQ